MQFYRRNLPHMQRDFTPHFITFCTKLRRDFPDWARDIVLGCCIHDHERRYRLRVAVVMPDHVHLILTPLVDRHHIVSLVEILKAIKGTSAHKINRQLGVHGPIWQEESFDRIVRSSESLDAKVAYILENPVRKRLVDHWREYRWIWQPPEQTPQTEFLTSKPRSLEARGTPKALTVERRPLTVEPRTPSSAGGSADEASAAPEEKA